MPVFHEILTPESLSRQHSRARYIAFAQFSMSRCLQRHCLLIAHIAQQAKPWLCLGHPAGGSLLQGGAQCSKETLERAVQKCECPCEPANELVRTTRLSTHNAQRGSQCTTAQRTAHNEALNAFFRLHSGLCFSYLASRQPPIQLDPFSLPRYLTPFIIPVPPPAIVVVWYYQILCKSKRLKYCYCCLTKEQAAAWGSEVFDRNNA